LEEGMRFIHFADLHLGVENYGHLDSSTGLNTRLLDFLSALDRLIEYAIDTQVDLVLFCGDAYKNREPTQTQQREFARRLKRLSENGIPVFLLTGNHDLPNTIGRATSTEIFDTLAVNNIYVANKPGIFRVSTKSGIVQIASLPWLRRSALLSRDEIKSLTSEQIKQRLEQVLTEIVKSYTINIDPTLPSILSAHVSVNGAQLGSEKSMSFGMEHGLLLSSIADPVFDYIALGHIHRRQELSSAPPVVYAGSLDRVDFGEEADDKGFYEVDIRTDAAGKKVTVYEFHQIEGRRFITINVKLDASELDPSRKILEAISTQPVKDAIVRIRIAMPEHSSNYLNDGEIRNALKECCHYTITREIARENRLRLGRITAEELTPLNALKAYLETKKVTPERTKILMEYGEKLIKEQGGNDVTAQIEN
jgi:DNA repair protein SbcD/Mre11